MITIAVSNQKGGVGKTTIAYNLSKILSNRRGTKVLAIDNDPQANLTQSFLRDTAVQNGNILNVYQDKDLEPIQISKSLWFLFSSIKLAPVTEQEFHVIFRLKEGIEKFRAKFDYTFIDCLPSFGHLQLAALTAADFILIPVKPEPYALAGIKDLIETIEKAKKYFNPNMKILGIAINQSDGRNPVIERDMEAALREKYGELVLKTKIRKRIKVVESPAFHQSITDYDPKSPAAMEFEDMIKEILKRIKSVKK